MHSKFNFTVSELLHTVIIDIYEILYKAVNEPKDVVETYIFIHLIFTPFSELSINEEGEWKKHLSTSSSCHNISARKIYCQTVFR